MPSYRSMSWALCAAMPMRATLMSQSSERRCDERDGEWGWRWGEREGRDGGGGGGWEGGAWASGHPRATVERNS